MEDYIEFSIPSAPPTANLIWRNFKGRTVLSKAASGFFKIVQGVVGLTSIPKDWAFCSVEIIVSPATRRGDVDNRIKPVLDALTRSKFWKDDTCVAKVSCRFVAPSKGSGFTIVRIRPEKEKFPAIL